MTVLIKRYFNYILSFFFSIILFRIFCLYLAPLSAPFIVAFFISRFLEKPVSFLEHKLALPRRISSFICIVLFFISLAFIAKTVVLSAFFKLRDILLSLPEFSVMSENLLSALRRLCLVIFKDASPQILKLAEKLVSGSLTFSVGLRDKIISLTSLAASAIPQFFLFAITLTVSTYFFSSDYYSIRTYVTKKLPSTFFVRLGTVKKNISKTVLCYIKALAILALITFAELSAGFILLRVDNAVACAFLIALFDALPILGSGFILIPWAIASLIKGMHAKAIGIAVIYLAVTLSRNMFEARIIGSQTGVHPLINLAAIYIGLHIFGGYGLLLPPLIYFLYQSLRPHNRATAE